jgi:hypothetical protein
MHFAFILVVRVDILVEIALFYSKDLRTAIGDEYCMLKLAYVTAIFATQNVVCL